MSDERVDRGHQSVPKSAAATAAMIPVDQVDHSRRRLLTAATAGIGAVGVVFAAVPFIASWEPSVRARALGAPVTVDASKLEEGQMLKVVWRGQPVFVVRRSKAVVAAIANHNDMLADPNSDDSLQPEYIKASGPVRARNPEYWVGLAVCTHLGCSPLGAFEPNNAFHGSKYDISGRVFKSMPAPKNLTVPPYAFSTAALVVIGQDQAPSST
jgi:ubiquinol-cytochrome c reductase iron-sulfur subunit